MPVSFVFITAVARSMADHLPATAVSVAETKQALQAAGHDAIWSVCVDEFGTGLPQGCGQADRVVELGDRFGVSTARNVAVANAEAGAWVFPIDGDDLLHPNGLVELAAALDSAPNEVMWVASNRLDTDGSRTRSWLGSTRSFPPGQVNVEYRHPYVFHPNNVAYRTEALFEAGGWPATPGGEDLALLLRAAKEHPGVAIPVVTVQYRLWPKQTTAPGSPFEVLRPVRRQMYERFNLLAGAEAS